MDFDKKKKEILKQIGETNDDHHDASPKGTLDTPLVPLIDKINEHKDMVTTSSCSGRVSVFLEGTKLSSKGTEKLGGKGAGGKWLYITHDPEFTKEWWSKVKEHKEEYDQTSVKRYILYKFEPMILHVKCRDQETANKLYSQAMSCGFRESGIGPNLLVAIRISIKLDVPVGYLVQQGDDEYVVKTLVNDEYVNELEHMSLELFGKNKSKIDELFGKVEEMFIEPEKKETKEERRERKKREGLERQAQLQRH